MQDKKKITIPEKAKKTALIFAAFLVLALIVGGGLYFSSTKKDFDSQSKSAIAMGTVVTSRVYGDYSALRNEEIINIVQQLEKRISRNVSDSAVSLVNSGKTVKLSELADEINASNGISRDTGGAFDLTIGGVSSLWDIGGENERKPSDAEIKRALEKVDYTKIEIKADSVSVAEGQQLDLGAIGKGRACDLVRAYLESKDAPGAVVSVGGSILAYGKRNKAGDKWRVAIKHPRNENAFLGTILLDEGFVSTSGDYEKYFEQDGKRFHHILDARTGYPAESDLISATVICDSGIMSDALSTACFILGSEDGARLAEKYGAAAIFVDKDENISTVGDVEFEKAS